MHNEIDSGSFEQTAKFCVYIHSRPDGSPFYVGKGLRSRALDFAPSRRTAHHRNIVAKYGRDAIGVRVIPCSCEAEAFLLERAHISLLKASGARLANLTEGGEGCAGRPASPAQLVALSKGRGPDRKLSEEAKAGMARGLAKVRAAWRESGAYKDHVATLGAAGAVRLHQERRLVCVCCGGEFITRSAKAKNCSRLCEQRTRRKKDSPSAPQRS